MRRCRFLGRALTHTARNDRCAGVFVDTLRTREGPRGRSAGPSSSTRVNCCRTSSVGEALARGGREHVGLARTRHHVQRGALLRDRAAADADDQVLQVAVDLGGAVDVTVGAELLDHVHGDRETGRGVLGVLGQGRGGGAVVLDDVEVLGADTHGHRGVTLVGGGLESLAVDGDHAVAELHTAVGDRDLDEVHRRRADEAGDEEVRRAVVHVARGVDLLEQTVLEHGHAVAHRHGLDLVVGDVDGGDAETALERGDLRTRRHTELGVQVGQRLVHEEDLRLTDDGAAHRDTLALTTGERLRLAVQVLGEVEDLRGLLDLLPDLRLVDAGDLEREAHVVGDRHVRVERVVLEHHGDVPVLRRQVRDVAVTDTDGTAVDVLEPRQHAERGGLATAGRADQDEELAVLDVDVETVDGGLRGTRVNAGRLVERNSGHGSEAPFYRQERAGRSVVGRWWCSPHEWTGLDGTRRSRVCQYLEDCELRGNFRTGQSNLLLTLLSGFLLQHPLPAMHSYGELGLTGLTRTPQAFRPTARRSVLQQPRPTRP